MNRAQNGVRGHGAGGADGSLRVVTKLAFTDHRADPAAWARSLGVSTEAVALYLESEVIDLHVDSFLWKRMAGYDLTRRHGPGPLGAAFARQVDLPRIREAQVSGAIWVITTNPWRTAQGRAEAFSRNLDALRAELARAPDDVAVVRTVAEYEAARAQGKHAAFLGIQGGNALDVEADGRALDRAGDWILRVTLVHLTNSLLGGTSAPQGGNLPLSDRGRDYVRALNARKIFVDLAHISRRAFFDALEVHDRTQPVLVTHTGLDGATPHWRNITDAQLRAVADLGGTVGVIYQSEFLGDPLLGGKLASIVRHLGHICDTVGEDFASLGSDWDGMIVTPRDMPTCLELPRLVDAMLRAGWSDTRVKKILGGNFLRVVKALRG
jgi:membrane dipeptidase